MRTLEQLVMGVMDIEPDDEVEITEDEACFFLHMNPKQLWEHLHKCKQVIQFYGHSARLVWWELN